MTQIRIHRVFRIVISLFGAALILVAVFAEVLGIDSNAKWGPSRKLPFLVGCLIFITSLWGPIKGELQTLIHRGWSVVVETNYYQSVRRIIQSLIHAIWSWCYGILGRIAITPPVKFIKKQVMGVISKWVRMIRETRIFRFFFGTRSRVAITMTTILVSFMILLYVWIISVGYWNHWPSHTKYYDLLGQAFLQGQTHLPLKPVTEILALSDPYEYENRDHIRIPWDVSLYDGKYYLYWGPAPGMITALIKMFNHAEISDNVLVFSFITVILIVSSVLLVVIWRRSFQDLPVWLLLPGIAVAGLANPMIWMLNRPAVYEAAISSGQFFLLMGILLSYLEIIGNSTTWRKFLVGACWALAVGSRTNLLFAVLFLSVMFTFGIVQKRKGIQDTLKGMATFAIPLIFGATLYAWYNFDRFGSIIEFGHQFQLGRWNKHDNYSAVLSIANIPPSFFDYFFNPYRTIPTFPYVKPMWGGHYLWPISQLIPERYYTEQITGLAVSTPFVFLGALPIWSSIKYITNKWRLMRANVVKVGDDRSNDYFHWLLLTLIGSTLLILIPLLLFVSTTMRHLTDVAPLFSLLASIGFWQSYQLLSDRVGRRRLWVLLVLLTMFYSSTIGVLLGITGYQARFENLNPDLFDKITRLFTW